MRIVLILFLLSNVALSQNYEHHRWKHRVIIITASTIDADKVEGQFKKFNTKSIGFTDRKLVLYKCIESTCTYYDGLNEPETFMIKNLPKRFSIKLLGLDGNEKFSSKQILEPSRIFERIDKMPMRRNELKSKND